jgi:hypothetical protein
MDEQDLHRLTRTLVAEPVVAAPPVAELERRAAHRTRRRSAAVAIAVVVVLALGGTALARAGRQSSSERVGTSTPTTSAGARLPLTIFVVPTATPAQTAAIQVALLADPNVTRLVYQDQADAYRQFRCFFADQPDLVAGFSAAEVPASFGVEAAAGQTALDEVARRIGPLPGIDVLSVQPPFTLPDDISTTTTSIPGTETVLPGQAQALEQEARDAQRHAGATPTTFDPRCAFSGTNLRG